MTKTLASYNETTLRIHRGKPAKWHALCRRYANLAKRAFEHRESLARGFSKKYGCKMLVWYELYENMYDAIAREKQIKAGSRAKKLTLIENLNPDWRDIYETVM